MVDRARSTNDLVAALQDLVYVHQLEPRLKFEVAPGQIQRLTGLDVSVSPDGRELWELLDQPDRSAVLEVLRADLGQVISQTLHLELPDGSRLPVRHRAVRTRLDDGSMVIVGTLNRHPLVPEPGFGHEPAVLRAALDAQPDPLVLFHVVRDGDGLMVDLRYIEANHAACRALQRHRSEVVGALFTQLVPDIRQIGLLDQCLEVVSSGQPLVLTDYPYAASGAPAGRFDVRATPVGDGLAMAWSDVSARYTAAKEREMDQAKYRLMLEESSDVTTFHAADGHVQWVSPAIHRVLGWPADLRPGELLSLVHPEDMARIVATRDRLAGGQPAATTRLRLRAIDGSYRWMESTARAVRDGADRMNAIVVISRDIQEQMDFEQALSESESRYRLVAENTIDVVYRTDSRGMIEWVSDGVQALLGRQPTDLVGTNSWDLVDPGEIEPIVQAVGRVVTGDRETIRARLRSSEGRRVWVEVAVHPVRDTAGKPIAYVGGLREVQAQVEAEQALDLLARTDDLTGLLNRREALATLTTWVAGDGEMDAGLVVAFIDLDGFKEVNDRRGHAAGDALLRQVAQRIASCVRQSDIVARMGGDELLLLMRGVDDLDTAVGVAEKIRSRVSERESADDQPVTVSIGVTMMRPGDDAEALIARADTAMYLAKKQGRNQVVRVD